MTVWVLYYINIDTRFINIDIPSYFSLNIAAWEHYFSGVPRHRNLINLIGERDEELAGKTVGASIAGALKFPSAVEQRPRNWRVISHLVAPAA